jgi:hypothetical protein
MERIGAAVRDLTPTQVDKLVDEKYMTDEQLTQLAQYDTRLQGYLRFEKLAEQSMLPGQLRDIRHRAPLYEATAASLSSQSIFRDLLAGKVQDPHQFRRLLDAYHSASQVKDPQGNFWSGSPALHVDDSVEATSEFAQYGLATATPDYHADIIAMAGNYIACHPTQKLALIRELIPQVQTETRYPDTSIKVADSDGADKFHALRRLGDARGVVVADTIFALEQEGDTARMRAALTQLNKSPLASRYGVFRAALQAFRVEDTAIDVEKQIQAAAAETGFADIKHYEGKIVTDNGNVDTFDGIGADPVPLLRLIRAARAPSLLDPDLHDNKGSPAGRADLQAHFFEAGVEAIEQSATVLSSEKRPISLLDLGSHHFVDKQLVPELTGLIENDTSLIMAALGSHQEPDTREDESVAHHPRLGAAALTNFFIFALDDRSFEKWARDPQGTLPLLGNGERLATVWKRLKTGDSERLDPAEYFLNGLTQVNKVDGKEYPFIAKIGADNLALFSGAYAGSHHKMATLKDKDLEALRYGKRGLLQVLKEAPAYLPGGVLLSRLITTAKSWLGYRSESITGGEVEQRNQRLEASFKYEMKVKWAAIPAPGEFARTPAFKFLHAKPNNDADTRATSTYKTNIHKFDLEFDRAKAYGFDVRIQ